MKSVYLAGPIAGLSYSGATQWREHAKSVLENHGIHAKTPMRGKSHLKDVKQFTNQGYEESPISSQKGIVTRDRFDVMTSDVILMNLLAANKLSVGSIVEMGWADAFRKPIVTVLDVSNTDNPHIHAFVKELSGYIVPTLDEALQLVLSLLDKQ